MKETKYPFLRLYLIKIHVPTDKDPEHRDFVLASEFQAKPDRFIYNFAGGGQMEYPNNAYNGLEVRTITYEELERLTEVTQYASTLFQHFKINQK